MISVQKMIFLYFCCAKIRHVTMVTLRNKQTTITIHNYDKSWNEAQAICQDDSNGNLFVEDSEEKSLVLELYKSKDFWDTKKHVWIGLHYPAVLTGTSFGWTDCVLQEGGFDHYLPSEPKNPASSKCVLSDKTSGDWITASCDSSENFVCESVSDTDCTYDDISGVPDVSISTRTTTVSDLSSCQDQCSQTVHDSMNCWAVNFDSSISSCNLFYLEDPFYLQSGLSPSSDITYIKKCYSEQSETTPRSAAATDSSSPTQVCALYSPFATTTTTSTTSTTSSTTSTTSTTSSTTSTTSPTTSTTSSTTSTTSSTTSTTSSTTSTTSPTTSTTSSTTSTTSPTTSTTSTSPTTSTPSTTSSTTSTILSSISTSSLTTSLTPTPFSMCKCACSELSLKLNSLATSPGWYNLTTEEKVALIVQRLSVDKSKLSSTIRKKTSAPDDRTESKSVGYVAITFMVILFGFIVLSDLSNFVRYLSRKKDALVINPNTCVQNEPETSL